MSIAFEQASYLAQVLRLRALAQQALGLYPLRIEDWRFLSHGENATFRVTANGGKRFLLRIHRNGYHTPSGILEELHWLQKLSRDSTMIVPRPILSKRGRLLENVQTRSVGAVRHCSVLEWIDGRFIKKSLNRAHLHSLGKLIGRLHRFGRTRQVVERRYWDAEGLLGSCAKLGSTDDLPGLSASDQKVISDGRRYILRNLKRLENRFPDKQGLIHADLHFGNLLISEGRIAAIDFDDCGFGFHAYDLVTPLRSAEHLVGKRWKREFTAFKSALIDGYLKEMDWDDHDEEILSYLMPTRGLVMLGWLNSRSDNPDVRKYFKTSARIVVKQLQTFA